MPYDVIKVADNDYACAKIGGRIVAVSGSVLTLDRNVLASSGKLNVLFGGKMHRANIANQPQANQVQLVKPLAASKGDIWTLTAKVQPLLYRTVSIAENVDEGTYIITALQHDPNKYEMVDGSAAFDVPTYTLYD